jgi:ATP-dependent RNA helicase DeaD
MGITAPTPIQARAIPPLLQGRDLVGQAPTGSGKTLAFGLPILERCDLNDRRTQALILVPTRELATQVGGVLAQVAGDRGPRVTLIYGGRGLESERLALRNAAHVVVGTPGRTIDHLYQGNLVLTGLRTLVLDEGDEMLDQGFAPDVERILACITHPHQSALFSATIPAWVKSTAARHLNDPVEVRAGAETTLPAIEHMVYEVTASAKLDALRALLDRRAGQAVLVFGRTKYGVEKLGRKLVQLGYPAGALQGNLSQPARERVLGAFRSGKLSILCATNVAARGLDIAHIGQVINYELPESAELFTHRVGRTGRMGRQGEAITFVTPEEDIKLRRIERALGRRLPRMTAPTFGRKAALA